MLKARRGSTATPQVEAFKQKGADFVVAGNIGELVAGMNGLTRQTAARSGAYRGADRGARQGNRQSVFKGCAGDGDPRHAQLSGDKLIRTAKPHKILDPANGPLIGIKLNILTRKTLGGLHTNLNSQVLDEDGEPVPGLYAAGEVAGFGGGGYHGYNALEARFSAAASFPAASPGGMRGEDQPAVVRTRPLQSPGRRSSALASTSHQLCDIRPA